jgi:segregation and condensation protein B
MTHDPDESEHDDSLADGELSVDALSDSFAQLFGHAPAPPPSQAAQAPSAGDDPVDDEGSGDKAIESETELRVVRPEDREAGEIDERDVPINPLNVLEAILFVGNPSNEPITAGQVSNLIRGVEQDEVDTLVQQLNATYDQAGCPYEVVSVGAGYRLMLRREFGALRDKFYGKVREARLTQAAIDVLSVVAYEQPLHRKAIEEIIQRPAGAILNQLVRRQLLAVERPDEAPRDPVYRTTDRFLELFGLASLDELPRSQTIDRDL